MHLTWKGLIQISPDLPVLARTSRLQLHDFSANQSGQGIWILEGTQQEMTRHRRDAEIVEPLNWTRAEIAANGNGHLDPFVSERFVGSVSRAPPR